MNTLTYGQEKLMVDIEAWHTCHELDNIYRIEHDRLFAQKNSKNSNKTEMYYHDSYMLKSSADFSYPHWCSPVDKAVDLL